MTMSVNTAKQTVLVANQPLNGDNSGSEGLEIGANTGMIVLPPNSRVLDAALVCDVAFDGTTPTIALSSTNSSVVLSATAAATAGVTTAATVKSFLLTSGESITVTLATGSAITEGSGAVVVRYIIEERATER